MRFVTEHWPPYNFVNEQGDIDGIAVNIVKAATQELNWPFHLDVYHWAKAFDLAKNTPNVFLISIYPTEPRKNAFQWICPLVSTQPVSFFRLAERNDIRITRPEDARGYITGVIREGLSLKTLLDYGFDTNKDLYIALDDDTNLMQLLNHRVDLIVDEYESLKYRLDKMSLPMTKLTQMVPLLNAQATQLCIATSLKTNPEYVAALKLAVTSIVKTKKP